MMLNLKFTETIKYAIFYLHDFLTVKKIKIFSMFSNLIQMHIRLALSLSLVSGQALFSDWNPLWPQCSSPPLLQLCNL